jgi:hypothetical protein
MFVSGYFFSQEQTFPRLGAQRSWAWQFPASGGKLQAGKKGSPACGKLQGKKTGSHTCRKLQDRKDSSSNGGELRGWSREWLLEGLLRFGPACV